MQSWGVSFFGDARDGCSLLDDVQTDWRYPYHEEHH
jgi:hypothetical protein